MAPSGFGRMWSLAFTGGFFLFGRYRPTLLAFAQSFDRVPPGAPFDASAWLAFALRLGRLCCRRPRRRGAGDRIGVRRADCARRAVARGAALRKFYVGLSARVCCGADRDRAGRSGAFVCGRARPDDPGSALSEARKNRSKQRRSGSKRRNATATSRVRASWPRTYRSQQPRSRSSPRSRRSARRPARRSQARRAAWPPWPGRGRGLCARPRAPIRRCDRGGRLRNGGHCGSPPSSTSLGSIRSMESSACCRATRSRTRASGAAFAVAAAAILPVSSLRRRFSQRCRRAVRWRRRRGARANAWPRPLARAVRSSRSPSTRRARGVAAQAADDVRRAKTGGEGTRRRSACRGRRRALHRAFLRGALARVQRGIVRRRQSDARGSRARLPAAGDRRARARSCAPPDEAALRVRALAEAHADPHRRERCRWRARSFAADASATRSRRVTTSPSRRSSQRYRAGRPQ